MTVKEQEAMALTRVRARDPWPRLVDWFDTMLSADFGGRGMHTMRVEEFVKDGVLTVRAELPGMDPDKDIEVTIGDGLLTIDAEREERKEEAHRSEFTHGKVVRVLSLPASADESTVSAEYTDGILEVRVQLRSDAEAKATNVPITRPT